MSFDGFGAVSGFVRERDVLALLESRGVNNPRSLIDGLSDEAVRGAVRWWDDQRTRGQVGVGLLVHKLREGGFAGYGRTPLTESRLARMRGVLGSPDGIDRGAARVSFEDVAARLGVPVDELLDAAVGAGWQRTPRHPAFWPVDGNVARYERLVGAQQDRKERPSPRFGVERRADESEWDFACRFWGWRDDQEG